MDKSVFETMSINELDALQKEIQKVIDKKVKEFRIIDTSNNKVLKTFKADERDKGYKEMREMGKKLKDQGKEDTLVYKEFRVKAEAKDTDYIIVKQTTDAVLYKIPIK